MIYQIEENNYKTIYNVSLPDKCISRIPVCCGESTIVTDGPSKVEILVSPKSSPGPRGKSMIWEDLTPSQKAEITPTISVGSTTTLPPESDASVTDVGTDKDHVLDFAIPRGNDGESATIQVSGTITVNPDTPASVINEGTEQDARFLFHIPRGQNGVSPTVRVGTVSTLPEGSQATVRNSGTTENVVLDFGIPRGDTGSTGPAGQVQDVLVSSDGETWTSAMVGNVAKVLVNGGGGGGGEVNVIEVVQKNGVDLPVVNKTVNVQVPTSVSQLTQDIDYARTSNLSNVAFSGSYNDLQNKPTIPTKTSDLVNDSDFVEESDLATVATSGSYNDLSNKPTIPPAQVNSDWNSSSGVSQILNKPSIPQPAQSISSGETGYATGDQVYQYVEGHSGESATIWVRNNTETATYEVPAMNPGEKRTLIITGNGVIIAQRYTLHFTTGNGSLYIIEGTGDTYSNDYHTWTDGRIAGRSTYSSTYGTRCTVQGITASGYVNYNYIVNIWRIY